MHTPEHTLMVPLRANSIKMYTSQGVYSAAAWGVGMPAVPVPSGAYGESDTNTHSVEDDWTSNSQNASKILTK